MVGPQQPSRIYPLGRPESGTDPRFTLGLMFDVADVLTRHGYPDFVSTGSGPDVVRLQQALFRLIYGADEIDGGGVRR